MINYFLFGYLHLQNINGCLLFKIRIMAVYLISGTCIDFICLDVLLSDVIQIMMQLTALSKS